jgi:hypothetical protein
MTNSHNHYPHIKKKRKSFAHIYKWVRKLHYRAGILISIFFIIIALTGIAINHSNHLSLDKSPIPELLADRLYNQKNSINGQGFDTELGWLSLTGYSLYLNDRALHQCSPPLIGALALNSVIYAVCHNELWILTDAGEEVEHLNVTTTSIHSLGHVDNTLYALSEGDQVHRYDDELGEWVLDNPSNEIHFAKPQSLPIPIVGAIKKIHVGHTITWERLLLDLHSGRVASHWGIWLVDFVALALLFSSLSGLWMWRRLKHK